MHATVQPSGLNQSYTSLPGAGSGNPFGSSSNSSLSLGRYASSVSVSGPTTPYSHPYGHAVAAGHGIGRKQVIHHTHQQLPSIHDISKDWDDGQDVHMDGANPTYRVVSRANHPSTKFRDSELTFFLRSLVGTSGRSRRLYNAPAIRPHRLSGRQSAQGSLIDRLLRRAPARILASIHPIYPHSATSNSQIRHLTLARGICQ
jgi:hypothetical protein